MANLTAAVKDMPSAQERVKIEGDSKARHPTTNYFQEKTNTLVQPTGVKAKLDGDRVIVEWNTAFAGPEPIRSYEVMAGTRLLASLPARPQLFEAPLSTIVAAAAAGNDNITVTATERQAR